MVKIYNILALALLAGALGALPCTVGAAGRVEDIATRPGVTVRTVTFEAENPLAVVLLFAGGEGGLRLDAEGRPQSGARNFLVRSQARFAAHGLTAVVVDAPSDRQTPPFLAGFRDSSEHVADIKALIAHWRQKTALPVWLVGTSRGTQSAAYASTRLQGSDAADGLVLTSTLFSDKRGRPVPAYALDKVAIPVLLVHHAHDGCPNCDPSEAQATLGRFKNAPRKALQFFEGGVSEGSPCEAEAYHGYNGIEDEVVAAIAAWIKPLP